MADFSEFSGERMPEKTTFSQTCTLLSQYLKENGSFGDLSLGIIPNDEGNLGSEMFHQRVSPMRLFPEFSAQNNLVSRHGNLRSMDLFPQEAGFGPTLSKDHVNSSEIEGARMTIFYDGKVIVFDNFPADKAKEVMLMASNNSSHGVPPVDAKSGESQFAVSVHPNSDNTLMEEQIRQFRPIICDLPIARKASLQRFLEKRKHRIIARVPYQMSSSPVAVAAPVKPVPNKQWLGLSAQSPQ